jgi:hypothetical protein
MSQPFSLDITLPPVATLAGASNALAAINTTTLPDGASVFVNENRSNYRYSKFSTAAATGELIIAPAQGGAGRWIQEGGGSGGITAWLNPVADTTALEAVSTTPLLDGTAVYVQQTGSFYFLAKTSTVTASGFEIVTGLNGGRWYLYASSSKNRWTALVRCTEDDAPIIMSGANDWQGLTSIGSTFVMTASGPFSLSTTLGIVTYNGPSMNFRVRHNFALRAGGGAGTVAMESAFSVNNARIGGSTENFPRARATFLDNGGAGVAGSLSLEDYVTLTAGDTLRSIIRNVTNGDGGQAISYSLLISPQGL